MVRHEAAEALGAIGDHAVRGVLQSYCSDPTPEVSYSMLESKKNLGVSLGL